MVELFCYYFMESVLVLGGTGFVGSHLCNLLESEGFEVYAGSIDPSSSVIELEDGVNTVEVNILDEDGLDFGGYDVVVNLVGLSPLKEPSGPSYSDIHVDGFSNVVDEFEDSDADFLVHMSALGADSSSSIDYIRTKGEGESVVRDRLEDYVVLRPSVIFGDGGEFTGSIRDSAERSRVFPLPLWGRSRFQPVFIGDLTCGISRIIQNKSEYSGMVFEFGGPDVLSFRDVAEKVYVYEKGVEPFFVPIPGIVTFTGLAVSEVLPFVPYGLDQYSSLKMDNIVEGENGFAKLGVDGLTGLSDYL